MKKLIFDLWWFIENHAGLPPGEVSQRFFQLRDRVRALQEKEPRP